MKIETIQVKASGGSSSDMTNKVNVKFIDSDGTILKNEFVASGSDATPPAVPVRQYLTLAGWQGGAYAGVTYDRVLGPRYTTENGDTFFFITIPTSSMYFIMLTKDTTDQMAITWDGVTFYTSSSGALNFSHTFAAGDYVVRISCAGKYSFGQGSGNGTWRNSVGSLANSIVTKVYYGAKAYLASNALNYMKNATDIVLSEGVTNAVTSVILAMAPKLKALILPNTITLRIAISDCFSLAYLVLSSCSTAGTFFAFESFNLEYVNIEALTGTTIGFAASGTPRINDIIVGPGVQNIIADGFYKCKTRKITFPTGLLTLGDRSLYNSNIEVLDIPSTITGIGTNAIAFMYRLKTVICRATTPPTMAGAISTGDQFPIVKIYVPDASVAAYKVATGWTSYSSYIFPLSQYVP